MFTLPLVVSLILVLECVVAGTGGTDIHLHYFFFKKNANGSLQSPYVVSLVPNSRSRRSGNGEDTLLALIK
jgi:hypothetical protein